MSFGHRNAKPNKPIAPLRGIWALERATNEGMTAAYRDQPYNTNPYPDGSPERLSWSQAHNGARANRLVKEAAR